jgi:hypothetical protein
MSYLNNLDGKYFNELVDNQDFKKDLESFFTGGRYNHSREYLDERGVEGLANDFVEHMRFQDMNEASALYDYQYVQNTEMNPEGKKAFGRLMQAYDQVEGGGTGFAEGAWDYLRAFGSAPSTAITAGTFGFGIGSKILAKAGIKSAQMSLRKQIADMLKQDIAKEAIKKELQKNVLKSAGKAGAVSFAYEGAIGAGHSAAQGETREEVIDGYEYTTGDVIRDGAIAGTLGMSLGVFGSVLDSRSQNKALELVIGKESRAYQLRQAAAQRAIDAITNATNTEARDASLNNIIELSQLIAARSSGNKLDPLDPESVAKGQELFNKIMNPSYDGMIEGGLDINTIRGVAAAGIRLNDMIRLQPGERISAAIARSIDSGALNTRDLRNLANEYGLSNEELSYLWLADLSKAGQKLAEGSKIKRALGSGPFADLTMLARSGVSTVGEAEAEKIFASLKRPKYDGAVGDWFNTSMDTLRTTDAARIAFMTSQLGTTAANVGTGGINMAVDISDEFWKNIFGITFGRKAPDGTVKRYWVPGTISILRGMTFNKAESQALAMMMADEAPEAFKNIFYETTRAVDNVGGNSVLAKSARTANILNTATDAVFKQAALYGSIDRQLKAAYATTQPGPFGRAGYKNIGDFLRRANSLNELPEGVMERAIDDAKRFTFQRDYKGDTSAFGRTATFLQRAHYQAPFVISQGLDMPFPRYMANHLEYINDYTPIGIATGMMEKFGNANVGFNTQLLGDVYKTGNDRVARQMTGMMLITGGVAIAAHKEGKIDYGSVEKATGNKADLRRIAGPYAASLLIGDIIYRMHAGLPLKDKFWGNAAEVLGDTGLVSNFGALDFALVTELNKSAEQKSPTENLEKMFGDFFATFTYPTTILRDVEGQTNYFAAGSPYTRAYWGGLSRKTPVAGERNVFEEIIYSETLRNQATRFLPDYQGTLNILNYNEDKDGLDFKKYKFSSPYPVGAINPLSRQFGVSEEPASTQLQMEMEILGIKEYSAVTKHKNPTVDYYANYLMAKGAGNQIPPMWEEFERWKKDVPLGPIVFRGKTYDELDSYDAKRQALTSWIKDTSSKYKKLSEEAFNSQLHTPEGKRKYANYVANVYQIEKNAFIKETRRTFDDVVKEFNVFEGAQTAEEFLMGADTLAEQTDRRRLIMEYSGYFRD